MTVNGKRTVMNATNSIQSADRSNNFAGLPVSRVLVPVDFSVCTLETLRYAKALAGPFAAVVDVLHVVPFNVHRDQAARSALSLVRDLNDCVRRELKAAVGVVWASEARAEVSVRVRQGRTDEVILREAAATHASLIIMGTRGRSWLSRLLRHQTVKRVVQNAPCPVVVLRAGTMGLGTNRLPLSAAPAPSPFPWHPGVRLERTLQSTL